MGYPQRESAPLVKAQDRLRGLQSIHPNLNLGNGLTLQDYAEIIQTTDRQLQAHNVALVEADRTRIELATTESNLKSLSSRVLITVAALYGKESKEYEMAGGTPPSRSKRAKKAAAVTPASAPDVAMPTPAVAAISNGNGAKTNGTPLDLRLL